MGKSVLELFSQKEVLNYQKDRKYPALMGEELFPEVKKRSLKFDMIVNKSKTPVIASVHGFDTESEIGQRKAQKKAIELALIKRKLPLTEEDIIALRNKLLKNENLKPGITIDYESFLILYAKYKNDIDERTFALRVLLIPQDKYLLIKRNPKKNLKPKKSKGRKK